jgi:hypothetical protein
LPEARFSVLKADGDNFQPSQVLHHGEMSFEANDDHPAGSAMANVDTAGIAIDPMDETVVWIAHDYVAMTTSTSKTTGQPITSPALRMAIDSVKTT